MGEVNRKESHVQSVAFEAWSKRLKEKWWKLNRNIHWSIRSKKTCPKCGRTFNCHDCNFEYWLCHTSTDWRNKTECLCPECDVKEWEEWLEQEKINQIKNLWPKK